MQQSIVSRLLCSHLFHHLVKSVETSNATSQLVSQTLVMPIAGNVPCSTSSETSSVWSSQLPQSLNCSTLPMTFAWSPKSYVNIRRSMLGRSVLARRDRRKLQAAPSPVCAFSIPQRASPSTGQCQHVKRCLGQPCSCGIMFQLRNFSALLAALAIRALHVGDTAVASDPSTYDQLRRLALTSLKTVRLPSTRVSTRFSFESVAGPQMLLSSMLCNTDSKKKKKKHQVRKKKIQLQMCFFLF